MGLISIAGNAAPEGAITGTLRTADGVALRHARWDGAAGAKGTVCLLQGRTEYIEKYFETVGELRSRGFAVVTFDWRGQGLSDRALADRRKGYVESFRQYDLDLDAVIDQVVLPNCPPPFIALAHSMGGAVALRAASGERRRFDRMILTAPMIGLPHFASSAVARAAVRALRLCGLGSAYVPGGGDAIIDLRPFAGNSRSSDPDRYARNAAIVSAEPALGLGSPTIAWTDAALAAMREFAGADYPAKLRERTLIIVPGGDAIASPAASVAFAGRSTAAAHLVIAGARHELLMEQDRYRAQFWSAFDSFVA